MGTELRPVINPEPVITRWVTWACEALEPAEREVVCGDLAEAGEYGWLALRQVLNLVIRRRVLSLETARCCLPIGVLTIPTAVLLTLVAMRTADGSAIYLWMWINNSDWAILQNAGFWNLVLEFAPGLLFSYIALACCSWTCGLLIGWSSRRTCRLSALLLVATVVSITVCGLPGALGGILDVQSARNYNGNAAVFRGIFYSRIFPGFLELVLVTFPAWWGMHQTPTIRQFTSPARFLLLVLCSVAFGVLVCQNLVWPPMNEWGILSLRYPRLPDALIISAPIVFFVLIGHRRLSLRWARPG